MSRYQPPPRRTFPRLPVARPPKPDPPPAKPSAPSGAAPGPASAPASGGTRPGGPEFLRVARVAQILDIRPKRVYQLIRSGELEAMRLGPRQVRVSSRTLQAYIGKLLAREADRMEKGLGAVAPRRRGPPRGTARGPRRDKGRGE